MSSVTLEVESSKKLPTVLLSRKLTDEQREHLTFSLNMSGSKPRLVGADDRREDMPIEGSIVSEQKVKYAIGYRDSGSSSMRVFECDLFSVDPSVKRARPSDQDSLIGGASFMEQRQTLIDSYAPAKKRRQVKLAINAQVKDEKIHDLSNSMRDLRDQMKDATEGLQESGVIAQMSSMLPPFDLKATDPAAIYDFSSIFPDSLIAELNPQDEASATAAVLTWLKDVKPATPLDHPFSKILSLRVIDRLAETYLLSEHMKRKSFARMLVLAGALVQMFIQRLDKNRSAESLCIPESVKKSLESIYGWGKLNTEGQDKLLCHICLFLAKLTPDFCFNFMLLTEDIKGLTGKDLQPFLEFCGFKIGTNLTSTLQAPLKVAEIRRRKAARK